MTQVFISQAGCGDSSGSSVANCAPVAVLGKAVPWVPGNTYYIIGQIDRLVIWASGTAAQRITVRGDYAGSPGSVVGSCGTLVMAFGVSYFDLIGLSVSGGGSGNGFHLGDSTDFTMSGVAVRGCANGIYAGAIKRGEISADIQDCGYGVQIIPGVGKSAESITIRDSAICKNKSDGIYCATADSQSTASLTISDNRICGNKGYGVRVRNAYFGGSQPLLPNVGHHDIKISGNVIEDNAFAGVHAQFVDGGEVSGNVVARNSSALTTGGIWCGQSADVVISGNTIHDNMTNAEIDGQGVLLDGLTTGCTVSRNLIYGHRGGSADNSGQGVAMIGTSGANVYGNVLIRNKQNIWLGTSQAAGNRVSGNISIDPVAEHVKWQGGKEVEYQVSGNAALTT